MESTEMFYSERDITELNSLACRKSLEEEVCRERDITELNSLVYRERDIRELNSLAGRESLDYLQENKRFSSVHGERWNAKRKQKL